MNECNCKRKAEVPAEVILTRFYTIAEAVRAKTLVRLASKDVS